MASPPQDATEEEPTDKNTVVPFHKRKPVPLSNPLVAIMAIGKNNDKIAIKAKKQDYWRTIFAFNHICGYSVMYRSTINNENNGNNENTDEKTELKQDLSNIQLNYNTNKMDYMSIKTENYQLLWKSDEIKSFLNDVIKVALDEKNKHDSLIFLITSYTVENGSYMHLFDSFGSAIHLNDIYTPFDNDHCELGKNKTPMIFIIDRYFNAGSKEEALKINRHDWPTFQGVPLFKRGEFFQLYTHVWPLAIPLTFANGGVAAQAIKAIFTDPKIMDGKLPFSKVLSKMMSMLRKMKMAVNPILKEWCVVNYVLLQKK